jgi:hypothetical protein
MVFCATSLLQQAPSDKDPTQIAQHSGKCQPTGGALRQRPAKRPHTAAKTSKKAGHRSKDKPKGWTPQQKPSKIWDTAKKSSHKAARCSKDKPKRWTPQQNQQQGAQQQKQTKRLEHHSKD